MGSELMSMPMLVPIPMSVPMIDQRRSLVYDYAMAMKGVLWMLPRGLYDYVIGMGRTVNAFVSWFVSRE